MSSVQYVEINISNMGYNLNVLLDVQKKQLNLNGIKKEISDDKIDEFFRIIRLWKNEYLQSSTLDSEKFNIKIISNDYEDIIKGNGSYPDNYYEFKKWVGDISE